MTKWKDVLRQAGDLVEYGVCQGCIWETKDALEQMSSSVDPGQAEIAVKEGVYHNQLSPSFQENFCMKGRGLSRFKPG